MGCVGSDCLEASVATDEPNIQKMIKALGTHRAEIQPPVLMGWLLLQRSRLLGSSGNKLE